MPATLQPTKEQVRAHMQRRQREFACRHGGEQPDRCDADIDLSTSTLLLPGTIAQLATLLAVEWCFLAAGISRPN
ncbi:hypothetical protein [Duganella aceris]|uniref:Uncharacterized protein n=1 Tax=Duganella aceris TaxID=2703883 RepID=A0ABX0FTP3_9BURK|nr:hypothetical protein [Duganella aceris]NGZ88060.1 hypothetical protein [Duganella aceris]